MARMLRINTYVSLMGSSVVFPSSSVFSTLVLILPLGVDVRVACKYIIINIIREECRRRHTCWFDDGVLDLQVDLGLAEPGAILGEGIESNDELLPEVLPPGLGGRGIGK